MRKLSKGLLLLGLNLLLTGAIVGSSIAIDQYYFKSKVIEPIRIRQLQFPRFLIRLDANLGRWSTKGWSTGGVMHGERAWATILPFGEMKWTNRMMINW